MKMMTPSLHLKIQYTNCGNANLILNDFTYKDILTVDDDTAIMGGVMKDDEIAQDLIEVAEEEVQEEDKEVTDKNDNETND